MSGVERAGATVSRLEEILGSDASLLHHSCRTIPQESLHLPGPDFVDRVFATTDRSPRILGSLQQLFNTGRLGGTGYVSILPVDQGIEHSAGASFAPTQPVKAGNLSRQYRAAAKGRPQAAGGGTAGAVAAAPPVDAAAGPAPDSRRAS